MSILKNIHKENFLIIECLNQQFSMLFIDSVFQVVLLYYFLRGQLGQMVAKQELVKVVEKEVVRIWEMAGYKIVEDKHMMAKIEKLVNEYQALLKDIKKTHHAAKLKRE